MTLVTNITVGDDVIGAIHAVKGECLVLESVGK